MTDIADERERRAMRSETRWRRRSLLSLPVLLPLALVSLGYEHIYWFWHGNHLLARTIASGESASYWLS